MESENKGLSPAEMVGDCLLDRTAVAAVLGVTPDALNVMRHRGQFRLEPVMIGGRKLRWRVSDVRRYIAEGGDRREPAPVRGRKREAAAVAR